MAEAKTSTAALTGAQLLSAIAAGTVTRITQEQAGSLDSSHFQVNTADVVDNAAAVQLTDAGKAAAAAAPATSGGIAIDDDVPMPTGAALRGDTLYPFDKLEVGKSFHVAKTAENPDPATRLSSSVSGAHLRYSPVITDKAGNPVMEEYKSPVYKRDEAGEYVKENGKRVIERQETKTREKRGEPTRKFRIFKVDASDPRGIGARVFRVA